MQTETIDMGAWLSSRCGDVEGNAEDCPICLEQLDGSVWRRKECSHRFHIKCMAEWMHYGEDCPVCRGPVHPIMSVVLMAAAVPLPSPDFVK